MADRDPKYSRTSRKQGSKANKVNKALNISIGVVVVLIAVVAIVFVNGSKKDELTVEQPQQATKSDDAPIEPIVLEDDEEAKEPDTESSEADSTEEPAAETSEENSASVVNEIEESVEEEDEPQQEDPKKETSSDAGKKSVVDPNWKPIGTKQTGQHVSKYDGQSADWHEKKKAISYATGMSEDELIFLRIQNGGGPQKSEGIVSSRDNSKKYKVYLEWVDGQGWKPVKMDVLK
ncbi:hypothetical protein SporoP37_16205 [Sporosarcina sp. P37]|uniref:YrrS family protein n=1 Tax=unclassified Sporosarcina TaxID=2647733 RepID=UPI000A17CFD8|nr:MULTISPECIES: YrrS family protein [unclassified Sporosarcina]ARK26066.1 hypothetical protein SporoP37_16205 [Sporosarcina sp. P37]PID19435.1 DUF1510 domain-containing protein [Sporosarcina sp. P35]